MNATTQIVNVNEAASEQMIMGLVGDAWAAGNWHKASQALYSARVALNTTAPAAPVVKDLRFLTAICWEHDKVCNA